MASSPAPSLSQTKLTEVSSNPRRHLRAWRHDAPIVDSSHRSVIADGDTRDRARAASSIEQRRVSSGARPADAQTFPFGQEEKRVMSPKDDVSAGKFLRSDRPNQPGAKSWPRALAARRSGYRQAGSCFLWGVRESMDQTRESEPACAREGDSAFQNQRKGRQSGHRHHQVHDEH